nr:S1 RNA-binding domain-containing protein [Patescibacteria group bacterium]
MDIKGFASAISQIAAEKEIPQEKMLEIIQQALATAYKKEYREKGEDIKAVIDSKTGKADFWLVKKIVDDSIVIFEEEITEQEDKERDEVDERIRYNPKKHILAEEAVYFKENPTPGEDIEIPLESKQEFGRIAAQTAKQVILQKIKETEKELIMGEYKDKEGEVVSGIVQRAEGRSVFVELGKVLGVMPKEEQIPGEVYRSGQRHKFYVLSVEDSMRWPSIMLSRAFPKFVSKLFAL